MAKILIVDDAIFVRTKMKQMLSSYKHELIEAEDGEEAIKIYQKELPNLVLMDITMPKMDGISAAREIRKIDPEAKIIMCSAMGQQAKIMGAIQAGAVDFIVKPYKEATVVDAINKILETI